MSRLSRLNQSKPTSGQSALSDAAKRQPTADASLRRIKKNTRQIFGSNRSAARQTKNVAVGAMLQPITAFT